MSYRLTVADLIEILKEFNPKLVVFTDDGMDPSDPAPVTQVDLLLKQDNFYDVDGVYIH